MSWKGRWFALGVALACAACAQAEPPCDNTCHTPNTEQVCTEEGVSTCAEFSDGCKYLGQPRPCAAGKVCQQSAPGVAACVAVCANPCQIGVSACSGDRLRTCIQGPDGCAVLDDGVACPSGQRCDGAACVDDTVPCENDCASPGARTCVQNAVRECGQFDQDACLDLSTPAPCQSDESCVSGVCQVTCADTCSAVGARQCDASAAGAYRVCISVSGCLSWGDVNSCAVGERCDGGQCVQDTIPCTDECSAAGASCQGNAVVHCGQLDGDECLDAGTPTPCDAMTQTCTGGACVTRQAPSVVISEVLYDSTSYDDRDGNAVFVELAGAAGTSLDGLTLVGVDGSSGGDYNTIVLTGTIPSSGYVLVARPDARGDLRVMAQLKDKGVDYQNGSSATAPAADAIQLRFAGQVLDAVGYGAGPNTYGEGSAAPDIEGNGASLTRTAALTDTNNNLADFAVAAVPSPGGPPCGTANVCGWCGTVPAEVCTDGVDNDCDTVADALDSDCP